MNKQQLREAVIKQCKMLSVSERQQAATITLLPLLHLLDQIRTIALYSPCAWEFDISAIAAYCKKQDKILYQPLAAKTSKIMSLIEYDPNCKTIFTENDVLISNVTQWYNIELVLLPLVAVDSLGYRLGRGGGYYDATLNQLRNQGSMSMPILCGIGYPCQQLADTFTHDEWDVRLDYFVCAKGLTKYAIY